MNLTNSNINLNPHRKEANLYTVITIDSHGRVVLQEPSIKVNKPYACFSVCSISLLFPVSPSCWNIYEFKERYFI